jgi:hypothetical protein
MHQFSIFGIQAESIVKSGKRSIYSSATEGWSIVVLSRRLVNKLFRDASAHFYNVMNHWPIGWFRVNDVARCLSHNHQNASYTRRSPHAFMRAGSSGKNQLSAC